MRALIATLTLLPSLGLATPVTYEFSGFMANVREDVPHHDISGFITINMDALGTVLIDNDSAFRNSYENPILSFQLFGFEKIDVNPLTSYGSFDLHRQSPSSAKPYYTEWWWSVGADLEDGTSFGIAQERRCEWSYCPEPDLWSFLSADDVMYADPGYWTRMQIFMTSDSLGELPVIYQLNSFVQVPEPGTLGLLSLGLMGVMASRRRSARQNNLARS